MSGPPGSADRLRRAAARAEEAQLDGLYVTSGPNFRWLAGASPYPGGLPIWLSALLVPVTGAVVAVISDMHADILDLDASGIDSVITYADGDEPVAVLRRAFTAAGLDANARVGVEETIPFADVAAVQEATGGLRLVDARAVFDGLRAVKSPDEVDLLRRSAAAVDAGFTAAREHMRAGATLAAVGTEIYRAMLEAGAEQPNVSGAFRHYRHARVPLRSGDVVDVDLSARIAGYTVDCARTYVIDAPSVDLERQYAAVLHAYEATAAAVRPGVAAEEIHRVCADAMAAAGLEQPWKVGHGVGLSPVIHEAPLVQPGNAAPLRPGMAFTVDPGFFLRRDEPLHVEETVLVTDSGSEGFCSFPREMVVV